jgi:hypothetical protein
VEGSEYTYLASDDITKPLDRCADADDRLIATHYRTWDDDGDGVADRVSEKVDACPNDPIYKYETQEAALLQLKDECPNDALHSLKVASYEDLDGDGLFIERFSCEEALVALVGNSPEIQSALNFYGEDMDDNHADIITKPISITVDRSLDWNTNNYHMAEAGGVVHAPSSFTISDIGNASPNGGWIDLRIGASTVLCYQRASSTRTFNLIYQKTSGATSGCDRPSFDRAAQITDQNSALAIGDKIQFMPREPKLSGIITKINLTISNK